MSYTALFLKTLIFFGILLQKFTKRGIPSIQEASIIQKVRRLRILYNGVSLCNLVGQAKACLHYVSTSHSNFHLKI